MVVSIHQPNYIPWLGFFDKVIKSNTYVVFDDVQFPRGKDYANRNQIKTNNGKSWLTVPVIGKSSLKPWNTIEINNNGWADKHLSNIESFYKKTPYFNLYYPEIKNILLKNHNLLIDLNVDLIKFFLNCLQSDTQIVLSSQFKTEKTGLDKILFILNELNTTEYISGNGEGSRRYINEDLFKQNNIKLTWQQYNHPTYNQQFSDFVPYLSIIDLLFNEGPNSKDII